MFDIKVKSLILAEVKLSNSGRVFVVGWVFFRPELVVCPIEQIKHQKGCWKDSTRNSVYL